jgi:hypothetical protein
LGTRSGLKHEVFSGVLDSAPLVCYNTEKHRRQTSECATDPSFSNVTDNPSDRVRLALSKNGSPSFYTADVSVYLGRSLLFGSGAIFLLRRDRTDGDHNRTAYDYGIYARHGGSGAFELA